MRPLARPTQAARAAALLPLGALAVHELRYVLAYGSGARDALAAQGHAYLGELAPVLVVLALSVVLGRLGAAALGRIDGSGRRASIRRVGLVFAAALLAIFSVQELLEGAVFAGHAGGVAAILGGGGWLAIPLSLAAGFLAAIVDRLLAGAERALARGTARRRTLPRARLAGGSAGRVLDRALATLSLAFGLARRPPPAPSSA